MSDSERNDEELIKLPPFNTWQNTSEYYGKGFVLPDVGDDMAAKKTKKASNHSE